MKSLVEPGRERRLFPSAVWSMNDHGGTTPLIIISSRKASRGNLKMAVCKPRDV